MRLFIYLSSVAKTILPLVAITVPPLFVIILIIIAILTVVIMIIARRKKVKTTTKQEQIYYSEVEPPSTSVKHMFYEEISTLDEQLKKEDMHSLTKTSPQEHCDKVTEMKRDSNPVLGRNPAYGTNTAMAVAPDIDTEKNKAYGYLEPHASFIMADNSAYYTADVVTVDTQTL